MTPVGTSISNRRFEFGDVRTNQVACRGGFQRPQQGWPGGQPNKRHLIETHLASAWSGAGEELTGIVGGAFCAGKEDSGDNEWNE